MCIRDRIITVFNCKLQGKRANKAKKLIWELIQEETDGKSHKSNACLLYTSIYSQNPNACYVQSFAAWKRMGAHIQKGAKALQVLVPVETTLLKDGDHYVRYSDASKELQEAYKNNQIDSLIRKSYKIGNVFDISPTDFPKEKYTEYFSMGYPCILYTSRCV